MHCPRCSGLMVPYKSYDRLRSCWLMSCLICGELLDETVLYNRLTSLPFIETRARVLDFEEKFLSAEEANRLYSLELETFPSIFPKHPTRKNFNTGNSADNARFFVKKGDHQ